MKARRPHFASLCVLVVAVGLVFPFQKTSRREVLKIGIARLTHVAVGQSVQLSAYQEYQQESGDPDAVHAASAQDTLRDPIAPRWSVSDSSVASVGETGALTALKPGRVTIRGTWGSYEAAATVEVVKDLPNLFLPQMFVQGTDCQPHAIALSLARDRTLRFNLSFADSRCQEVSLQTRAPKQPLPWKFNFRGGTLELTNARGLIVKGLAHVGSGQVSFTAWTDGNGTYPVSLSGKTVLLIGDSMVEGIGWFLKDKVEAAGGRYVGEVWYSSTTFAWQDSGRLAEALARHHPDIVFIALGSNEIFLKQHDLSAPAIRHMVEEIGARPAYWIGPPSWKPDRGIVRVIEENFPSGRFYNSNDLEVPRQKDGAHPTIEGYETWTGLIWDWYARIG